MAFYYPAKKVSLSKIEGASFGMWNVFNLNATIAFELWSCSAGHVLHH
jgi:hypothetical protein